MRVETSGRKAVVCGAGGFIGGHLAARLLAEGQRVRCVDIKPVERWHQVHSAAENHSLDLRHREAAQKAVRGVADVYNLAADMGGIGFIETHKAACMVSVLINTHLLLAARDTSAQRYFYASSACVYPDYRQTKADGGPLAEHMAYPAMPEDGYGWEKLFSERMCRHFAQDYGLTVRIARLHNVYGPLGSWNDGREKAPAALCRKIAEAALAGADSIELWGDGRQTRSFMFVDDCVEGIRRLVESEFSEPLNLGSATQVSIRQLADLICELEGRRLTYRCDPHAPTGVAWRNSDNDLIRSVLGWEPATRLATGLATTYAWVKERVMTAGLSSAPVGGPA